MQKPLIPPARTLKRLIKHAGYDSEAAFARVIGYKAASGLQRYLDETTTYGSAYYPSRFMQRIWAPLLGRGDPPVEAAELSSLTFPVVAKLSRSNSSNVVPALDAPPLPARESLPKDIIVRGADPAPGDGFIMSADVRNRVARPPSIADLADVQAVYTIGEYMAPWRRAGKLVYFTRSIPPQVGDHVIVEVTGKAGAPRVCYLRKLVSQTDTKLKLQQYTPEKFMDVEIAKVAVIYRVLEWEEIITG